MYDIKTLSGDFSHICIPEGDALRYSGCRNTCDERLLSLCRQCIEELTETITLRAVYAQVPVKFSGNTADFGFYKAESASLRKFLGGDCTACILAATIGLSADRLISRYSTLQPSKAVILDGCATAAIECWCDHLCSEHFGAQAQERFSPGYGDLPLEMQSHILSFLGASLNIGLTMTDSMLLTPAKSVTAIVKLPEKNIPYEQD